MTPTRHDRRRRLALLKAVLAKILQSKGPFSLPDVSAGLDSMVGSRQVPPCAKRMVLEMRDQGHIINTDKRHYLLHPSSREVLESMTEPNLMAWIEGEED